MGSAPSWTGRLVCSPSGVAAFEIGDEQARAVGDLMRAAGFGAVVEHRDLSGAVRCLSAQRGSRQPI